MENAFWFLKKVLWHKNQKRVFEVALGAGVLQDTTWQRYFVSECDFFSVQICAILGVANCSQNQHWKHCELVTKMQKNTYWPKELKLELIELTFKQRPWASEDLSPIANAWSKQEPSAHE